MTPLQETFNAVLGFLTSLAYVAVAVLFLYAILELNKLLAKVRTITRAYFPHGMEKRSGEPPPTGHVEIKDDWKEDGEMRG